MRFLEPDDLDDPILSVVNFVDILLVLVGILLIIIVRNPLNPFQQNNIVVIENPGQANMKMTIKEGEELKQYESKGEIGEGHGTRAGITYRLKDGRMIYVPEPADAPDKAD